MSSLRQQDRVSLCRFAFSDGRQGRTPRSPNHPHFCNPCRHRFLNSATSASLLPSAIVVFLLSP
jgi:hypothetical protein